MLAPSELVKRVIFEIPKEEMEMLDELEIVSKGLYVCQTFLVMCYDHNFHRADPLRSWNQLVPSLPL